MSTFELQARGRSMLKTYIYVLLNEESIIWDGHGWRSSEGLSWWLYLIDGYVVLKSRAESPTLVHNSTGGTTLLYRGNFENSIAKWPAISTFIQRVSPSPILKPWLHQWRQGFVEAWAHESLESNIRPRGPP